MISSRLQKAQKSHNKGQDATTSNWKSNRQIKGGKILQQAWPYLEIQQCPNQGRRWIESYLLDKQRPIQTASHVLWIIQFTRNISKNNEQHIQRITSWRDISKLHGWLCHTSQDEERTRRKDNLILKDSEKTQFVF